MTKKRADHIDLLAVLFRSIFPRHLRNFPIPRDDFPVIFPLMRKQTARTILISILIIGKRAAAPVAEGVQRAIAEQTIKVIRIVRRMTGEIFTIAVAEKGIVLSVPRWFGFHEKIPPVRQNRAIIAQ